MNIDNIIIGKPIEGLTEQSLGIDPCERTIRLSFADCQSHEMFLPRIFVAVGLFKTTSEVKRLHQQRQQSKITDPLSKNLWRTIGSPEMTPFKIGKKVFWLIVGEDK